MVTKIDPAQGMTGNVVSLFRRRPGRGDPEGQARLCGPRKYTPCALAKRDGPANFTGDTGQFGKRGNRSCEFSLRLARSRFP
jgi:hypothetical protein